MSIGVLVLISYAVVMMIATVTLTKKEKNVEQFCVGDRKGNWFTSALSIAATWIWAPALFTSAESANRIINDNMDDEKADVQKFVICPKCGEKIWL